MEVSWEDYKKACDLTKKGVEIWRDIPDYNDYQVSNFGNVKNKTKNNPVKPCFDASTGYMRLNLSKDKKQRTWGVHILVAKTFIPNPENKRIVHHEDTDKTNNVLTNLFWVTDSENMLHAFKHGLCENTREAARKQQQILAQKPRTQRQIESARENIIKVNKRPKTEKQLETSKTNLNSLTCRARANRKHFDRHPSIRVIETGQVYKSQRDLANSLGVDESAICACLKGRRQHVHGFHFEYVEEKKDFLYPHQKEALKRMFDGCILNGSVGSGKSRVGIYYYFSKYGGSIENQKYTPMTNNPPDLYIFSTAKKVHDMEWEAELVPFMLYPDKETQRTKLYANKVVIASWNVIKKYADVANAFIIFDENKINGKGAWAKTFLKLAKNNTWILLSASNGDRWEDYETLFIAEGFFRNRTEFRDAHLNYSRYTSYPQVTGYRNETRLFRLRDRILIDMDFKRHTVPHHEDVYVKYDISKYKQAMKTRWDPFKNEPISQASVLCYVLRKIVNEDESRQLAVLEILEDNPKAIIFYNFDSELEILLNLGYQNGTEVAQYNGHKHEPIPKNDRWVYLMNYNAAEAWNTCSTNCMIFYSQNYSYKTMIQAAGRIDRLTTSYTDLFYYHLKSRSGIDLAISRALKEKKKFNERKWCKWD